MKNIIQVCIETIYINDQQILTTQNQSGFRFDKYQETCEENNEMATSMIIIQNGKIVSDFCSVNKRLLFNGNRINFNFKFKDFIGCLPNYPHAFGIGTKCCSAENNGFNNTCAEKQLLYTSDCCRGKSIDCPNKNGKCLNMGENSFLQIIFLNFII